MGDRLFIWKSRVGYIAEAVITGPGRIPTSRAEAPWPGGVSRFGLVVPIDVVCEISEGIRIRFVNDRQEITGISTNALRFGLAPIMDEAADYISGALRAHASGSAN